MAKDDLDTPRLGDIVMYDSAATPIGIVTAVVPAGAGYHRVTIKWSDGFIEENAKFRGWDSLPHITFICRWE